MNVEIDRVGSTGILRPREAGKLLACNLSGGVRRGLTGISLDRLVRIYESEGDALEALGEKGGR